MDINGITLVNGSNFIPCPDLFFDATKRISPDLVIAQTGTADYIMDSLIINGYIANKSSYDVNSCNLDIVVCRRKDYIE